MPRRKDPTHLTFPAHHEEAVLLIVLGREPTHDELRAALHLLEGATEAAWVLRPELLKPLTREQYRQVLHYAAYAELLNAALASGGEIKQIRTLMDHAALHIQDFVAIYPEPHTDNT